jgi:hypothetical protein
MTNKHWERHFLISTTSVSLINKELDQLYKNTIHTPDTEANYKNIITVLERLRGA